MGAERLKLIKRTRAAIAVSLGVAFAIAGLSGEEQTSTMPPLNSLMVIAPYKYNEMWVFDDPAVGLDKEPFIAGIDTMIDRMTAGIPDAERGFRAVFSAAPFPGYREKLEWRREESGGNWYYSQHYQMEGWLCPALSKYFAIAPKTIYVKPEPKG